MNSEQLVLLLLALAGCGLLHLKSKLTLPLLWLMAGLALSYLDVFDTLKLDPEVIFFVFLPPVLYISAWNTDWRNLKADLRIFLLLSVGLVLCSTFGIGWAAHQLIPALTLGQAFLLGAIISPPDAIAATATIQELGVPRRVSSILEGESLLNDACALICYKFALETIEIGSFSPLKATLDFFVLGLGGALLGWVCAYGFAELRKRIDHTAIELSISLLTPFAVYKIAESLHLSGVIACVVAGLYLGWRKPELLSPITRVKAKAFWDLTIFILTGFIFLLTGLQLKSSLASFYPNPLNWNAFLETSLPLLALLGALIGIRIVYVFFFTYVPRFLYKPFRERDPYPPWQNVAVIAWAGMRGVISIGAVYALPLGLPNREILIAVTFLLVIATLLVQGMTLPVLVSFFGLTRETCQEDLSKARLAMTRAALKRLDHFQREASFSEEALLRLRHTYQAKLQAFTEGHRSGSSDPLAALSRDLDQAHLGLIREERVLLKEIRDMGKLNDEQFQEIEAELDLEELRLEELLK